MIHAGCVSTELLLERRSPELSFSERHRVQQHLGACERCQREHQFVLTLSALTDEKVESQAVPALHDRIFAEARTRYARGDHSAAAVAELSAHSRLPMFALGGALACAAVALIYVLAVGRAPEQLASTAAKTKTNVTLFDRQGDELVGGELFDGAAILKRGAAIPEGRHLATTGPFVVKLAHARLQVARATSLSWSPGTRVATLLDGVAVVEVDPTLQRSFSVLTALFLVKVLGTEFHIDQATVTVARGRVQVLSRDSTKLLAELGPGQSFTYPAQVAAVEAVASASPGSKDAEPVKGQVGELKALLPASELLARARRHLSGGQPKQARADIAAALLVTTNRSEQAVAHMLTGDCALVEGNTREAVKKYLDVSRRFADLAVAETALFSAARVESNSGRKATARELLQSYLVRYPGGQFRRDADERLRALDAP